MEETLLDQLKAYKNFQSSKYIPVRGDEIKSRVLTTLPNDQIRIQSAN